MSTNKDWPISPTFLSLRKGCSEETANYNRDGIFYTDYIRGFLADLSHDERVQNALTLFQVVPENFIPNDSNAVNPDEISTDPLKGTVSLNLPIDAKIKPILNGRKIIRIESGTFINNGRRCACFRSCKKGNKDFCFKQDSIVGIFADEKLDTLDPFSSKYREKLDEIIASFNARRADISKIKTESLTIEGKEGEKEERLYIHYTCPKSLYEEHIFPIYAQDHIIACLVLGQMARESYNEDNTFLDDKKEMKEYEENKNKEEIDAGEKNEGDFRSIFKHKIKVLTQEEWDIKARAIFDRIQTFEKRLEERIEHRNIKYINDEFEKIEEKFRKRVKDINIKKQDTFNKFSDALNEAFATIRQKFDDSNDGFFKMFALPIDIEHCELIPIGWTESEPTEMKEFKFSLGELKGIDTIPKKEQTDRIIEAASQKIKDSYDEKHDVLLPGWLAGGEVAYIVWKRHSQALRDSITKEIFNIYKKSLRNFYSIALEFYSYIRGARMELLLETSIQESAHESAHFILPSINVVENKFDFIPERYIIPSFTKAYYNFLEAHNRSKEDVLESLNQLREINYGSSLILSPDLQTEKEPVQVYRLLIKLQKMLNNRALDSHKTILYTQNEDYIEASIDAKYFNHALFNLLDNAIKYSYDGSYIRINVDVDREKELLIIEIVSYGIEIEAGESIYHLYERSEEATKMAGGTGIGMYIVKKICMAHGGDVTHESIPLSDFNIPVLYNYKYRNSLAKKNTLGDILIFEKELKKLSSSIEQEVVFDNRWILYAHVFATRVKQPTYRNTFCIKIPLY